MWHGKILFTSMRSFSLHPSGIRQIGLSPSSKRYSYMYLEQPIFSADFADTFKEEKACNSNLDKKQEHDYQVIFADYQRLQSLRTMLSRYKSVLNSHYRIAHACGELSEKMQLSGSFKLGLLFDTTIHLAKIHRHQEKVEILSWQASNIVQMVRNFKHFYMDDRSQKCSYLEYSTRAVNSHLERLSEPCNPTWIYCKLFPYKVNGRTRSYLH